MKITYEFFRSLQLLLSNPNWREPLQARLNEIDIKLKNLRTEANPDINKFLNQIKNAKTAIGKAKHETRYNNFLEKSIVKSEKALKDEKAELEASLANNSYKIGVAPLDTIEHAKYLLANSHVLDLPTTNKEMSEVLKNMLRENFHKLADQEVFQAAKSNKSKFDDDQDKILQKIINNQKVNFTDFKDEYVESTPDEAEVKLIENAIKQVNILNSDIVKEVVNTINFIKNFYESNFISSAFAIHLAHYFNNAQDLHNFLTTVDFSTPQSVEAGILLIPFESLHLAELTKEERDLWHQINGKYGKEGIKLFAKALDIKNAGIQITNLYNENNSDLNQTFKILKEIGKSLKFAQEDSYPDIASLCHKYNYSEDIFTKIINEILPNVKQQDDQLPNIKFNIKEKGEAYTFSKLSAGDLRGLFLGKMTQCCQFIGGDSEQCVIDGFTKDTAGFYILTDSKGKILAQSYA